LDNYKGQKKKSAPVDTMEDPELMKRGFTHLEWEFGPASGDLSHVLVLYK